MVARGENVARVSPGSQFHKLGEVGGRRCDAEDNAGAAAPPPRLESEDSVARKQDHGEAKAGARNDPSGGKCPR